ncbi:hypothetical protein WFZ85_11905 [Flavobacterium sp. j3]|uniref:Uncharacterized protein n=1 Tax=Flavobacterium aureirubrum TaxID=3133147 RepID=A0ABU9N995_9FLAO
MYEKKLRICITTSDIAQIEGCSMRTASQKMNDMRVFFKKEEKRFKITFDNYAEYTGIPIADLESYRSASPFHHVA